jgi:hypothetical protein
MNDKNELIDFSLFPESNYVSIYDIENQCTLDLMNSIENKVMDKVNKILEEQNKKIDELTRLLNEKDEKIKSLMNRDIVTVGNHIQCCKGDEVLITKMCLIDTGNNSEILFMLYQDEMIAVHQSIMRYNIEMFHTNIKKLIWNCEMTNYCNYNYNDRFKIFNYEKTRSNCETMKNIVFHSIENETKYINRKLILNNIEESTIKMLLGYNIESSFVPLSLAMIILLMNIQEIIVSMKWYWNSQYYYETLVISRKELNELTSIRQTLESEYFVRLRDYLLLNGHILDSKCNI